MNFHEDHPPDVKSAFFGRDQEFIQIAQLVADQRVLRHGIMNVSPDFAQNPNHVSSLANFEESSDAMLRIIAGIFPTTQQYDLREFTELDLNLPAGVDSKPNLAQDDMDWGRQSRLQPQAGKSQDDLTFKAQTPYLSARRGEDAIEIAPPALYFWEELGLAPVQQRKNVNAFCIYPDNDTIRAAASTLLASMENSYQSCRFGRHRRGSGMSKYEGGLVPVPITSARTDAVCESLERVCGELGEDCCTRVCFIC